MTMIIPSENPPKNKADNQQVSLPPPGGPSPPPPPYPSHQSTAHYAVVDTFDRCEEPAGWRFIKAFLVASLIWVLTGAFVSSSLNSFGIIGPNVVKGGIGIPAVEDGDIDSCPLWTTVSHRAHPHLPSIPFGSWSQADFSLPINMDSLYLVSHGPLASGDLYVTESPEGEDVSVKVFVHHRGSKALSRATACQLSRGDGQVGVGIFTSRPWLINWPIPSRDALHFVIQVKLPRGAIRYIPSFAADLPMFSVDMDDLSAFRFGDVSLKSTNNHIKVQGAVANTFNIHSTNGIVSGAFNTTNSLTIETTNSPVLVRIGAVNEKSEKPTKVFLRTTNARIKADISLISDSSSGTGGAFGVCTHTTNSPIEVVYDDSPVDSVLKFNAVSTNSPVRAFLHRAYEGKFTLSTTNARAVLNLLHDVEDPSGQGRRRGLTGHDSGNHHSGKVEWVPSSHYDHAGSVNIATTNDVITLTV